MTIGVGVPPPVQDDPNPTGGSLKLHRSPSEGIPPTMMSQSAPLSPAMLASLSPAMAAVRDADDAEELTPTLPVS